MSVPSPLRGAALFAAFLVLGACATSPDGDEVRLAETHRQLAEMKLHKGEVELAIQEYQSALAIDETDSEAHFGLSEAYRLKGLYPLAEQQLQRTLELDPENLEAMLNLGAVYLHQQRWAEAIQVNDALLAQPTFLRPERALVNRGWAHYKSDELDLAAADFREALRSDPHSYFAHLNLGIVLYEKGQTAQAVESFEQALEVLEARPRTAVTAMQTQARYRLAQAHVRLGHHGAAVQQLEKAVSEGGQGEWAQKSREYLKALR